jgi:tRNA-dihydrouridine synthase B
MLTKNFICQGQLIQAPLAGYSCSAMRRLAWRFGGVAACCTEMLPATTFNQARPIKKRYRHIDQDEGQLWVQLSATTEDSLARATAEVSTWSGVSAIDLNCGCPKTKIRKKHCGSKLLANSKKINRFMQVMRQNTDLPVLIKIRVDADSGDQYNKDVALAAEDGGASVITVHGRHWTHDYDRQVSYEDIKMIKQTVSIPVIGNGDVSDVASAKKMLALSGCDAVMIARAAVGQPWLFAQISAELAGKKFNSPSLDEIGELLICHVQGLIPLVGETVALLQARKLAHYYHRHDNDNLLIQSVVKCNSIGDFIKCIKCYFSDRYMIHI